MKPLKRFHAVLLKSGGVKTHFERQYSACPGVQMFEMKHKAAG